MEALAPTHQHRIPISAATPVENELSSLHQSDAVRAWVIAMSLMLIGYTLIPLDTLIASFMRDQREWSGWKIVQLSEIFAHAWGVGLIALGIASLTFWNSPLIPRLMCASLGAGLLANAAKMIVARTRPHSFDLTTSSWDSFQGFLPWWNGVYENAHNVSTLQSFPSAHAATAAGLAWALSRLYPTGKLYFTLLCVLAICQRLVVEAHYASDVCWGTAIGVLWASSVFGETILGRRFKLLENWLAIRWKISRPIA